MKELIKVLWDDYVKLNPDAEKIYNLLGQPKNDHIAFRTFHGISKVRKVFAKFGYTEGGHYDFEQKKLIAIHMEHANPEFPKIFISQLKLEQCTPFVQSYATWAEGKVPDVPTLPSRPWRTVSHDDYKLLLEDSEYAAWVMAWGLRANHFTVDVSSVGPNVTLKWIENANKYLKEKGFTLNTNGGEIKGSKEEGLKQSSTIAPMVMYRFTDGIEYPIRGCYLEFAERFQGFEGFIAKSADKIFESTDK